MWTFRCYVSEQESVDFIDEWYAGLPDEVQGEVDATLEILRIIPRRYWRMPLYRDLRNWDDLHAIRIKSGEDHYRIVGFFGPDAENEFTLLVPFKKDDDPDYIASCTEAQMRMTTVLANPGSSHECFD